MQMEDEDFIIMTRELESSLHHFRFHKSTKRLVQDYLDIIQSYK